MKRLFLTLIAILTCSAAFAEQSEAQAQWVPTHEFHIDLFGGYSALNYQIDQNFLKTKSNFTDNLAGGAGFGYTWHLNDWLGLTTGAEFALYRGGFTATDRAIGFTKLYYDPNTNLNVFSAVSWTDLTYIDEVGSGTHFVQWNDVSFSERQTVYSAQIPLMVQFMAPLNARKSHHFYAAVGARVGFNFLGNWSRTGVSGTSGRSWRCTASPARRLLPRRCGTSGRSSSAVFARDGGVKKSENSSVPVDFGGDRVCKNTGTVLYYKT